MTARKRTSTALHALAAETPTAKAKAHGHTGIGEAGAPAGLTESRFIQSLRGWQKAGARDESRPDKNGISMSAPAALCLTFSRTWEAQPVSMLIPVHNHWPITLNALTADGRSVHNLLW